MRLLILFSVFAVFVTAFPLLDLIPEFRSTFNQLINSNIFQINLQDNKDRLIKLGPNEFKIVSEIEKLNLKRQNKNFIDLTNQISIEKAIEDGLINKPTTSIWDRFFLIGAKQIKTLKNPIPVYNYPTELSYTKEVKSLFELIDIDLVFKKLTKFSSFFTRYYKSQHGFDSANWLYDQLNKLISEFKEISITKIHHDGWDQFSIIVSIPGELKDKVIVGAHQDSANLILPNIMRAPGADDDGSGTVTTLESLRVLLQAYKDKTFKPYNTLEFHYYSAEEGGLLGSVDVFSRYSAQNETVVGMLQQDMTGYTQGSIDKGIEPHFGLISDYTSIELNEFLKLIINNYNNISYLETQCGYACSDHASALENGYPSSFLIESDFKYTNKFIHSNLDTIDRLDFDHIKEHIKLTIAYAYELSLAKKLY
ncbi:LAP1 [Candida pseudojiufengensis]|uniref:LAP1 n=1 Tax=Candida pseudojiufengensis TaxID=497109 RepID=UPI002224B02B|nr:LAP1 [Candida pseudojiufengensis]KAI5960395.1 LAP1 [Candida pseudojiufengensis]